MLFGASVGSIAFGNPFLLPQLVPLSWTEECQPTVATEDRKVVEFPGYVQTVDNLWVLQEVNPIGSIIRRCV